MHASKTVRILAVMVEFQKDSDDLTVGDGSFNSIYKKNYTGKKILDPLPHTADYFAAHLLFAKNYFNRVSSGNLNVSYSVLPKVYTLSKTMRNYSPPVDSTNFKKVADMISEAWTMVDKDTAIDFSQYDLFAIFHAGVGRDVSLPGSLGNELDIPSVYLNLNALQKYFGVSSQGVSVNNGSFFVQNSMVLPQTENREVESYGTTSLVQITINGLLVSSIASHLGLPDLFDTKTGLSAIGRFGLMDGQSIFAYNGLFPTAPSAWEKIDLGWVSPVTATIQDSTEVRIKSALGTTSNDTTIVKIPITADEYFLVENRMRDANGDSAVVTMYYNGSMLTKRLKDTTGFYSYNVDSTAVYGVLVDIDEPDWALSGSGALIWHIDDAVIRAKRASDGINANKSHRGVNLMQASGSQDIGETYTSVFGDQVVGEGSSQDFWRKGNDAKLFRNVFDDYSRPSARANNGALSLLTLDSFSTAAKTISFTLRNVYAGLRKEQFKRLILPSNENAVTVSQLAEGNKLFVQSGDSVFIMDGMLNQNKVLPDFSRRQPAIAGTCIVGVENAVAHFYDFSNPANSVYTYFSLNGAFSSDPLLFTGAVGSEAYIGTISGNVLHYAFRNTADSTYTSSYAAGEVKFLVANGNNSYYAIRQVNGGFSLGDSANILSQGTGLVNDCNITNLNAGKKIVVVLTDNKTFQIFENGIPYSSFTPAIQDTIHTFSVFDLKRDGTPYIVFQAGTKLHAYNLQSAQADNFPVTIGASQTRAFRKPSAVLAADNSTIYIYALAENGLHIINGKTGRDISTSPLAITGLANSQSFIFNENNQTHCATVDTLGNVSIWSLLATQGTVLYSGPNGDASGARISQLTSGSNVASAFLPSDRTYNYPNPVYDKTTYFRFYVNEQATVVIKIFDLAGDYVAQLTGNGRGGFDNEIAWDVTGIQSGVYLARLEATGVSGQKAHSVIKVAIIK